MVAPAFLLVVLGHLSLSGLLLLVYLTMEKQTKLEVLERGTSITSADVDDAAAWVAPEGQYIDPYIERRVRRKIDMFFMPTFIVGYGLVYYDKAILGSASLLGMLTDLQLSVVVNPHTKPPTTSTQRLSWATALFYFGMLAGLYPMTLLVQKFRVGRVLPVLIVLWVESILPIRT